MLTESVRMRTIQQLGQQKPHERRRAFKITANEAECRFLTRISETNPFRRRWGRFGYGIVAGRCGYSYWARAGPAPCWHIC
jgi:hypothetical protein